MRIGIDARVIHFPGIGRYIGNLLQSLAALDTDDRFTVYLAREEQRERLPARVEERFAVRMLPSTFSLKEQWIVPRTVAADQLDVFHTPHYVIPLFLSCPCVATFHDLTYYKHPASLRSVFARSYYRTMHRVGHRRAARIICDSESTRRDLNRILDVPDRKLETIYPGLDGRFGPVEAHRVTALRRRLGCDDFILYVGTKKRFKNLPTLMRAFQSVMPHHPTLQLVLAGRGKIEDPEIERLLEDGALRQRVKLLEPLPDEEMPALYAAARVFVLPSFNEGFGFPLAEAMACGTPCIAANATSLPEVAGDAALLFPPHDAAELARLLLRLIDDRELARELSERGRQRARLFDGSHTAARTYQVYLDAVARGRRRPIDASRQQ